MFPDFFRGDAHWERLTLKHSVMSPGSGFFIYNSTTYQWSHRMGEFVTAAASAGLTVRALAEFPYCYFRMFPCMVQRSDGYWEIPDHSWPLLFSMDCNKVPVV